MAYVSEGPVSTMPGASLNLPVEATCDHHPDRPAVKRIQGETDSFGCEAVDMCQECYDTFINRDRTEERTGRCDWCGQHATDLAKRRDYDEGMAGRLYDVCGPCRRKANEEASRELADMDDYYDYWD